MNKPDVSIRKWDAIYKILDSLFSVAVLPFAIYALFTRGTDDPTKDRLYSAAFFFVFSLSFVCQALRKKNRSEKYTWQLIQAGVYLVSVILILAVPNSSDSLPIITILFAVMMILNRVLSIVKKPTYRNIFFNVPWILLIIAAVIWIPKNPLRLSACICLPWI